MRAATSSISSGFDDYSKFVTLKIWSKTGSIFEEIFSVDRTTFADVKHSAIRHFQSKTPSDPSLSRSSFTQFLTSRSNFTLNNDSDQYKLISVAFKRTIDEKKTLGDERIKDGDEFLLATKFALKSQPVSDVLHIDERLIESRTEDLPKPFRTFSRDYRLGGRTEFRTDLNCILITLIETSQKLLWCHPDAENIFKQAEEILSKSSMDDATSSASATTSNEREIRQDFVSILTEMGFTDRQAQVALKRTKNDLHAAMELLFVQPDLNDQDDADDEHENETPTAAPTNVIPTPLFTRDGPFIPFRQYRQQRFQPNSRAIQSLKDMGFEQDDIVDALRRFSNDQNLACEYLLSDRQQQQSIVDTTNDQGLDPNSTMFQSIMQNPVVQRTLNNPKTFFVMLKIAENPGTITNYLNDPDIGNMLLQISRIYHAERDQMHTATGVQRPRHDSSRTTDSFNTDFDNDSD